MAQQQIERELGIGGIVLGAAGVEGLAVLGQGRRIDREEHEEVIVLQRVDDRSLGELKSTPRWGHQSAGAAHLAHCIDARADGQCRSNSRCSLPAGCRQTSCLRSAQSMPTKAANSLIG